MFRIMLSERMNSEITVNQLNTCIVNIRPLYTRTRVQFIKENYGYNSYKLYQSYENTGVKPVRLYSDLDYLY